MGSAPEGRIITFYSYKGGTGRSMALANTAWALANNGQRVLVVDWDLEAPGVHRYFHPFLPDKALADSRGLIDLVMDYATEAINVPEEERVGSSKGTSQGLPTPEELVQQQWFKDRADILHYAKSLKGWGFPGRGTIDLLPAGRQDVAYATRVNSFDWNNFYKRLSGALFFKAVREQMRAEYDFVLIDSRTGVSDTAGICTVEMPDALVICFTLNNQSIDGAAAVAQSVVQQRRSAPLPIFPVPTRLHNAEQKKIDRQLDRAHKKFADFPPAFSGAAREQYWRDVAIPYASNFAFEEILAAFGEKHRLTNSIASASERLTGYLAPGREWRVEIQEELRLRFLAEFEGGVPEVALDPIKSPVAYAEQWYQQIDSDEQKAARRLFLRLVQVASPDGEEAPVWISLDALDARAGQLARRLVADGLLMVEQGEREPYSVRFAQERLLREWPRLRNWIDDDRSFLLWRDLLGMDARVWLDRGRKDEELLPPIRVEQGRRWEDRLGLELSGLEKEFLEASSQRSGRDVLAHAQRPHPRRPDILPAPLTARESRFDAFISYSMRDTVFVKELTSELSEYSLSGLGKRGLRFAGPISISVGESWVSEIQRMLEDSEYFILVASPAAAQSQWTAEEVRYWLRKHSPEKLIILLRDGRIAWDSRTNDFNWALTTALPRALRGIFTSQPLYVDLQPGKDRRDPVRHIAARLYGESPETLLEKRFAGSRRQNLALLATVGLSILGLVGTCWSAQNSIRSAQDAAKQETESAQASASRFREQAEESSKALGAIESLLAARQRWLPVASPNGRFILTEDHGQVVLLQLGKDASMPKATLFSEGGLTAASFSPDSQFVACSFLDGRLSFWRLPPIWMPARPEPLGLTKILPPIRKLEFSPDGSQLLGLQEGGTALLLGRQGEKLRDFNLGEPIQSLGFSPDGQQISLLGSTRVCTVSGAKEEPSCANLPKSWKSEQEFPNAVEMTP
jgi:cellulose biosynthesis protein BcsQ